MAITAVKEDQGFWEEVGNFLLHPLGDVGKAADKSLKDALGLTSRVNDAITTVEVVLLLLAIAAVLFVIYNPNALKGLKVSAL